MLIQESGEAVVRFRLGQAASLAQLQSGNAERQSVGRRVSQRREMIKMQGSCNRILIHGFRNPLLAKGGSCSGDKTERTEIFPDVCGLWFSQSGRMDAQTPQHTCCAYAALSFRALNARLPALLPA